MLTLLQVDVPTIVDLTFVLCFIITSFAITGFLIKHFTTEKQSV